MSRIPSNSAEYDYIIVGAGTAGCVVASRLAEQEGARILLLEAGPPSNHWSVDMPSAFGENFEKTRFNWALTSVPQPHLNGRRIYQPAGRTVGGSSAINGMVYLRGHALDFERWAQQEGAPGWAWADVLPYFKKAETYKGATNGYHGTSGPLEVRPGQPAGPLDEAFLRAGQEAGYPVARDVNGFQQEGFGVWDANIAGGKRASAATAYLGPSHRGALTIKSGATVTRIFTDAGAASGVEYLDHGTVLQALATEEVIISAGALHTPKLLMLSGIGDERELKRHGVEVLVDSPNVGKNLQDHIYIMVQFATRGQATLNRYRNPARKAIAGLQWFASHRGVVSSNHIEVGAFMRLSPDSQHPDGQIHFKPVLLDGWGLSRTHGFNFGLSTMRPESSGTVRLADSDPLSAPVIDPRYLSTERDFSDAVELVGLTCEIAGMPAFSDFRGQAVSLPLTASKDEIRAFVREATGSGFHPCGTCRMGTDDRAVCTPELEVNGVRRLRVVDASVFPSVVSANTNATTFMLAERASDVIRGRALLSPEPLSFYGGGDGTASTPQGSALSAERGGERI